MNYALITPARNEERIIEKTLDSMIAQTCLPLRWVIVDDGSTDRTADIVARYARDHQWIELIRRPTNRSRTFAGKVHAFNIGLARVKSLQPQVIGSLDADISFAPDHLEFLLGKLAADPELGVVGSAYTEDGWASTHDSFEGGSSVSGACQLFRWECFAEIGGYVPHAAGGIDWIAVTTARMKGWRTRNFAERSFHHHRPMGTAERGRVGAMFDYGRKDYFLGGSPLWELCRVAYRMTKAPLIAGGLALGCGYLWAALRRTERPVTPQLMRFHRREQMAKLSAIFRSLARLEPVDKFTLGLNVQRAVRHPRSQLAARPEQAPELTSPSGSLRPVSKL